MRNNEMGAQQVSEVAKERIDLGAAIPLDMPLVIYVEPSGYCNFKCFFCPHGDAKQSQLLQCDIMSLETCKKLIEDVKSFEGKLKLIRICGDGEPLINPNICQILQMLYEAEITSRIEVVTNGVLLTAYISDALAKYADRVIISIEGLNVEEYEQVSSTKINFEDFLEKLRYLYSSTRERCILHLKIQSEAVKEQDRREKFMETFGRLCDEISVENLVQLWPEHEIKNLSMGKMFRYEGECIKEQVTHKVCPQIFKSLQVYANGDVTPCCVDWQRKNNLGNILKTDIKEIWLGNKLRDLQIRHLKFEKENFVPCLGCSMNDGAELDNLDEDAEEILKRI